MCADLARNRPGESLKRIAEELSVASPGRSVLARLLNEPTAERAFRKGSEGEEEVARRLSSLGDDWFVINSIPVSTSGTDIDHLVIGPAGVFTLNTKNHLASHVWIAERTFMVNGHRQDYLPISRTEGVKVTRILTRTCGFKVNAQAVIVVMANKWTFKGDPKDVSVVPYEMIKSWLRKRPVKLTPDEASIIYNAARNSEIWLTSDGHSNSDPLGNKTLRNSISLANG